MSLDRSLKTSGSLVQHRSVLTRAERVAKMRSTGKMKEEASPLGLPKMLSKRIATVKKPKKAAAAAGAEGAAAPAAAGAPAAGAKAAAPAAGAKAAAPAAKPAGKK